MNLQQVETKARDIFRRTHRSLATERTYLHWIRRYAGWCRSSQGGTHQEKIVGYLTHLAMHRNVSPSTQSVAKNAIHFL